MIDVFVPTCARDGEQSALMLRSLDTFLERNAVGKLSLAAVDNADFAAAFAALDTGKFSERTERLRLRDLGLSEFDGSIERGWDVQQVAKLVYARRCEAEFYMVLDSKNLALRELGLADLVQGGRGAQIHEMLSFHTTWWRGSAWALGHRKFDRAEGRMVLSSATPALFHTASVRAMLDWLEKHHKESIERFFLRARPIRHKFMRPTEFTMYHVYMDRERLLEKHHFASTDLHDVGAQIWPNHGPNVRAERFERIVSRATRGCFTGIARPVWDELDEGQRGEIRRLVSGG